MVTRSRGATTAGAWHRVSSPYVPDWDVLREQIADQPDAPELALWFVRHGETATNTAGLITGTRDAPLNERGRRQARAAGAALAVRAFDLAFASQLRRSRETLELMIAAGRFEVADTVADARLAERSLGELELTKIRARQTAPPPLSAGPRRGESYLALTQRCLSFLLDLRMLAAELDRPATVLVSSHQGPMRIFAGILERVSDPVGVLVRRFENSLPECMALGHVGFPAFVGDTSEG
ncbi:MAG: histidine phosphatase family protein [Actinomycetota bacterium]|nr:histidine phosphatase family protein [Actinomycetota bacterium]